MFENSRYFAQLFPIIVSWTGNELLDMLLMVSRFSDYRYSLGFIVQRLVAAVKQLGSSATYKYYFKGLTEDLNKTTN